MMNKAQAAKAVSNAIYALADEPPLHHAMDVEIRNTFDSQTGLSPLAARLVTEQKLVDAFQATGRRTRNDPTLRRWSAEVLFALGARELDNLDETAFTGDAANALRSVVANKEEVSGKSAFWKHVGPEGEITDVNVDLATRRICLFT